MRKYYYTKDKNDIITSCWQSDVEQPDVPYIFVFDDVVPHINCDRVINNQLVPDPEKYSQQQAEAIRVNRIIVEIEQLKAQLAATDYKCLKYADGALTEEEYAPIKADRATWRARINELEQELHPID